MKPRIAPATAAELTAQIPARLIRKLDADPRLAERWTWAEQDGAWTVQTDKGDLVTLAEIVDEPTDIRCSCLLQPRCLHLAAVVAVLDVAELIDLDGGYADADADAIVVAAPEDDPIAADVPSTSEPTAFDARGELDASAEDAPTMPDASTTPRASSGPNASTEPSASTGPSGMTAPSASARRSLPGSAGQSSASGSTRRSSSDPAARRSPAGAATRRSSAARGSSAASSASAEARRAFAMCAELLATGAEASGAFAQAELLRSIHTCRNVGLHRLAAAQTRVLRSIRDLRGDRPEFSLGVLTADLRDALAVAWRLSAGDAAPSLVGTARRDYEVVGSLHVRGLFTEAVVARSGYAGAATYLLDERGAIYTRSDIAPGDVGRAAGAYDAAAGLGDAVLPHRELSRAGLFLSDATASADGRLGAGQRVRAVRASEPARWDHPTLEARWRTPLEQQLAAVAAHDATPDDLRPAGWNLLFVEGVIAGGAKVALVAGDRALLLATTHHHRLLAARDNLSILARASGLRVRAIGRVRLAAAGRLELLALGPAPDETRLVLPESWHGRANIHYDRLAIPAPATPAAGPPAAGPPAAGPPAAGPPAAGPSAAAVASLAIAAASMPDDDLLEPLRRRLERVVLGGLGTLPVHALLELERDATALADRALTGGADALRDLAAAAHGADRAMTGTRRTVDRTTFAQVWLRAALYDDAARRRLSLARW